MDRWILDVFGRDMNAIASGFAAPRETLYADGSAGMDPKHHKRGETVRQFAVGAAEGVYQGGKSMVEGLASLANLVAPFTTTGMLWQLVDPHAPTMRDSEKKMIGAASAVGSAVAHPKASFEAAKAAARKFRAQFEAERAKAEKNGTEAKFYGQFAGRAGFEIIAAMVPAEKLAEFASLAGKAGKAAEIAVETERAARLVEATAEASRVLAKAAEAEPALTSALETAMAETGGKMVGLQHRLKTAESLARKIAKDAEERGISVPEAAARVRDAVRYTAVFPPEKLVAGAESTLARLKSEGNTVVKLKNTWLDPHSSYKGVNVQLRTPSGQVFELQFHTADSYRTKEELTHAIYEKMRKLDPKSKEWKALNRQQMDLAKKLQVPKGIENLKQ